MKISVSQKLKIAKTALVFAANQIIETAKKEPAGMMTAVIGGTISFNNWRTVVRIAKRKGVKKAVAPATAAIVADLMISAWQTQYASALFEASFDASIKNGEIAVKKIKEILT